MTRTLRTRGTPRVTFECAGRFAIAMDVENGMRWTGMAIAGLREADGFAGPLDVLSGNVRLIRRLPPQRLRSASVIGGLRDAAARCSLCCYQRRSSAKSIMPAKCHEATCFGEVIEPSGRSRELVFRISTLSSQCWDRAVWPLRCLGCQRADRLS